MPADCRRRVAERLILHVRAVGKTRHISGQKGEREILVVTVLGKMEADPPDLVPERSVFLLNAGKLSPLAANGPRTDSSRCATSLQCRRGNVFAACIGGTPGNKAANSGSGGVGTTGDNARWFRRIGKLCQITPGKPRQYASDGLSETAGRSLASVKRPFHLGHRRPRDTFHGDVEELVCGSRRQAGALSRQDGRMA